MPQLDPTWFASQLFWLLVSFVLLYLLISRVMLPPMLSMMSARKETIDGDINDSHLLTQEAEKAKEIYELALAEARMNSRKLIDDAMADHQAKADQSYADLQDKISVKLSEAEKMIAQKREAMLSELSASNVQMAELITKKLTTKAGSA